MLRLAFNDKAIGLRLAHSRYKYVVWLERPFRAADLIRIHENDFRFFGGISINSFSSHNQLSFYILPDNIVPLVL